MERSPPFELRGLEGLAGIQVEWRAARSDMALSFLGGVVAAGAFAVVGPNAHATWTIRFDPGRR